MPSILEQNTYKITNMKSVLLNLLKIHSAALLRTVPGIALDLEHKQTFTFVSLIEGWDGGSSQNRPVI